MSKLLSYKPPRIAAALLAVSIGLWYFSPTYTLLYMPYQLVASICITVGFIIMMFAWLQFKKSDAAVCPTAKTSRIVMDGTYRYTRNPMYLGMLLQLSGASFIMGTVPSMGTFHKVMSCFMKGSMQMANKTLKWTRKHYGLLGKVWWLAT